MFFGYKNIKMSRIKIYKIKPNTTIEDLRWSKDQISNLSTKKLLTHFNRIRKTKYFVFSTGWCCSGKCFHNTEYDDIEWTYKNYLMIYIIILMS